MTRIRNRALMTVILQTTTYPHPLAQIMTKTIKTLALLTSYNKNPSPALNGLLSLKNFVN
jgi:hypothetical protein